MLRVFTDESGTPGDFNESKNNFGEKYLSICSILIRQGKYRKLKEQLEDFKDKYQIYLNNQEIKSHSIRRSNPKIVDVDHPPAYSFYKYDGGQNIYDRFCEELETIIKSTDFKIICVATNKETARSLYPSRNILLTMLSDLWERIAILHHMQEIRHSNMIFDPSGTLRDRIVRDAYQRFISNGSPYIPREHIKKLNLAKGIYPVNSDSSAGLQLADYCAYPMKVFAEKRTRNTFFVDVIQPKLCPAVKDKSTGKTVFMGLKTSLNR